MEEKTIALFQKILKCLKPPEQIPLSNWADKYRKLPSESSSEPGRWKTSRTPYLKKIMDSISDRSVRKVVIMSSAQVGKSEVLLNTMGYFTHIDPSPILLVQPTVDMGKDFSKERIGPTYRDTEVLKNKLGDENKKSSTNTLLNKFFPGGYIAIVGANSPVGLASRPIKILLCDEIDRWPQSAGDEGDSLAIVEKRTTTFSHSRKNVYVSTPTIDGISRIQHEFLQGTQEEWQLPCPGCGYYQTLSWDKIKFTLDETRKKIEKDTIVTLTCEKCGEINDEYAWKSGDGRWTEKVENEEIKSFHLSSLISPWKPWLEIVEAFLAAKNDKQMLKVWTNTELGDVFMEEGSQLDELELHNRREFYNCELPKGVLILTAGVDVQDDRLEVEVVGWGRDYESWGIEYKKIYGDLSQSDIWDRLDLYLSKTFKFENGTELNIANVCIDTGGHFTTEVYKYCHKPHKVRITAIKGKGGVGIELINNVSKVKIDKEKKKSRTIPLYIIGVDSGKETLMGRLKVNEAGSSYCHFPKDTDKNYNLTYFKGLTSEYQITKMVNGKPKQQWVQKPRTRNEPFDLRNYATVALEIISPINYDGLEEKIEKGINYMVRNKK